MVSSSVLHHSQGHYRRVNERSILDSIVTRIAIDFASWDLKHVKIGDNNQFVSVVNSELNRCLTSRANVDQTARPFKQDLVQTLCEEGVIAVVATDTTEDPRTTESYDVLSMRVGTIIQWYPSEVMVSVYNEQDGTFKDIRVDKRLVAIVENPLYSIMNARNSTLQRLQRKLAMLDNVDEQSSSGKLDLIFQLPYTIKSEARRDQANKRRKDIEDQLVGSKYGIAYVDSSERITQLNRPAENNLLNQIEYLTNQLYAQLGLTPSVFDGTASEMEMLNYHNRTIEPIAMSIVEALETIFISKTGRSQKQAIRYFRDPFRLVPVANIAEIADKFTRNEILTSNEIRPIIGFGPSDDPKANELRNSNLNQKNGEGMIEEAPEDISEGEEADDELDSSELEKSLDEAYKLIDKLEKDLGDG